MGQPESNDEVQTPARVALAALERLCTLTENQDRIHADHAIVARFLYESEIEMESVRRASDYRESQATMAGGHVLELDGQLKELRGVMHSCSLQLAALVSSASALCDRLDELNAGDLCLEMRAVRLALSGQRVEAMARFLDNSVLETQVRAALRRILKQLEAKPESRAQQKSGRSNICGARRGRGGKHSLGTTERAWRTIARAISASGEIE